MTFRHILPFAGALASASLLLSPATAGAETQLERGEYLVTLMLCADCHSPQAADGGPDMKRAFSGGLGFEIPGMGVYWAPNLTPDPTGLGGWSADQIVVAVRSGMRPDGRLLAPMMPYGFFSALTDEDAAAIAAFLQALDPIENAVPAPVSDPADAPAPYLTMHMPMQGGDG